MKFEPKLHKTQVLTKARARAEAKHSIQDLTDDELTTLERRINAPLRIKDFNIRMCKRVVDCAKLLREERDNG